MAQPRRTKAQRQIDAHLQNNGHKPLADGAVATAEPELEKPAGPDYNDEVEQFKILHPEPRVVDLSFEKNVLLHPYSIQYRREAFAFIMRVNAESIAISRGIGDATIRVMALLTGNRVILKNLCDLVAIARQPAAFSWTDEAVNEFGLELFRLVTEMDIVSLYAQVVELSGASNIDPKVLEQLKKASIM